MWSAFFPTLAKKNVADICYEVVINSDFVWEEMDYMEGAKEERNKGIKISYDGGWGKMKRKGGHKSVGV